MSLERRENEKEIMTKEGEEEEEETVIQDTIFSRSIISGFIQIFNDLHFYLSLVLNLNNLSLVHGVSA